MSLKEIQKEWYNNHQNYLIEFSSGRSDTVAVYFCSNDLFFPHTKEMFEKFVVKKNRYEWYNTRINRASKHIFIRDVYKQWYALGLNINIPDIKSMYEFLKKESEGFGEIITVGSSAGGYASTLFGTMLGANICYNFNGQWNLYPCIERNGEIIAPVLNQLREQGKTDFFDLSKPDYNKECVFYFFSNKSPVDISQNEHIKSLNNINRISFNTSHHGIPFLKNSLKDILQYNREELLLLSGKTYNPVLFSCRISGYYDTVVFAIVEIWKVLRKKLLHF